MHAMLVLSMVVTGFLTGEAGSFDGGGTEGAPGADEGFTRAVELPVLAYPAIAAAVLLSLLAVTFAFRSLNKRH